MTRNARLPRRRGLSLVEAVVSIAIVGIMAVAAFAAVGATRTMEYRIAERERGLLLAEDLLAEIVGQAYADPVNGRDSFGRSIAEAATGDRSLFDDVDDYDGWTASPPQQRDGADLAGLGDWRRTVEVAWVDPAHPNSEVGSNRNLKKITVRVLHRDREVMVLTALRSDVTRDSVEQVSLSGALSDIILTVSRLLSILSGG